MEGIRLGPYQLLAELGSGGMGKVYRADVVDAVVGLESGQAVALKVIHPHLLQTPGFFKRFLREADIGRTIEHANVVRTLDCDARLHGGVQQHFLVMEYVEGQTLRDLLKELDRVPEELCRHIGREIAKGLAAMHEAGVVHRDLKPENVLITPHHVVKVMDLGVARLMDEVVRLSQTGAFVGSLHYAAPEQLASDGRSIDGRADLHALGLLLYELSTGSHPFKANTLSGIVRHVLETKPRKVGQIHPQLSPFYEEVVQTLLQKDPDARFRTARELADVLEAGEDSDWWHARARALQATTKRPIRRIHIPRETAVYGRERELDALRAIFERAQTGQGQVVVIDGEAGVGKSRLVDELMARLRADGEDLNFLVGGYPPGGAASATSGFSSAFHEHFGEVGSTEHLKQTPTLVTAFDALLRMEGAPEGAQPLTKASLQTCFVNATRSLAAERVTVVLIEDLHFAPSEGRAIFTSVGLAVPGHRILLIGTARPGVPEDWQADITRLDQTTWLPLPRLGAKDLIRLLEDTLKSPDSARDLAAQVALKSDGNPFFVFEIIRGLREGQLLRQTGDGTWVTTRVIEEIEIPSSVLDLVNARVASLSPEERDILDVACCLGFEFDPSLVAEVLDMPRIPLLKQLAQIERAHRLIRASGRRFVFDHHQVQEALYASLPVMLREAYHSALANTIEASTRAADRDPAELDGALCVDLCEHYLRGASGAHTDRYLDVALGHLTANHLHARAIALADMALAVPDLVRGERRVSLLLGKVRWEDRLALTFTRRREQRAALEEALALATRLEDPRIEAQVGIALGGFHVHRKEFDAARRRLEWARERLAETPSAGLLTEITRELGSVSFRLGQYERARDELVRALALAEESGDSRSEAATLGYLGTVHHEWGRVEEAHAYYARGLALARTIGDRQAEARIAGAYGNVFLRQGRMAEARAHYERLGCLARELGFRTWEATAAGSIANTTSDWREARKHTERALTLAVEIGARDTEATARINLAVGAEERGLYAEALRGYERGERLRGESHNRVAEHGAAVRRAALLARLGNFQAASEVLGTSHTILAEIGALRQECDALYHLGEVAEMQGELERASTFYERARGKLAESAPSFLPGTLLALGRVALERGQLDEGARLLADALDEAARLDVHAVTVVALAVRSRLDSESIASALDALAKHEDGLGHAERMEARHHLFQATGDRRHLKEAKRLLDHLVQHAPEEHRVSIRKNVRLHREILEAWETSDPG